MICTLRLRVCAYAYPHARVCGPHDTSHLTSPPSPFHPFTRSRRWANVGSGNGNFFLATNIVMSASVFIILTTVTISFEPREDESK